VAIGARTFTGDVLARLGLVNVFGAGPGRYPHVEVEKIRAAAPEAVLLPDEPYPFTAADGPEEFPAQRVVLVSGRLLTWHGPSLATARADLLGLIGSARSASRQHAVAAGSCARHPVQQAAAVPHELQPRSAGT
jgi:hypothetical protein